MRFLMSAFKLRYKKETRVNGCLLGEHPFDEEIILNKNKNKNKVKSGICLWVQKK